tara:strand:- start:1697 stop:2431 length:735 start_codon:yes stop_codon:yes gene_type:complete
MKIVALLLIILSISITFSQETTSKKLPPIEMLKKGKEGERQNFYELPSEMDYKIFNSKGKLVDSGHALFVDYTNYEPDFYFIHFDGSIHQFEKEYTANKQSFSFLILIGFSFIVITICLVFVMIRLKRTKKEQIKLLNDLKSEKNSGFGYFTQNINFTENATLNKHKIEKQQAIKLNDSDWKIINTIMNNSTISNKELANQVALSVEGTRSSLKKMYRIFDIPSSRNMRLALVIKIVQISKQLQ